MHAVITRVSIHDRKAALTALREDVVPQASQAPGFVTGYWMGTQDDGISVVVFDSEDAARAMAERVSSMVPEHVTFRETEVREVVAHA